MPGEVASGTMPFLSNAGAMPGAVVTVVAPPRRCTAAAGWVPAPCDVAADAAVVAEPARPAIAATAATYLKPRMCFSLQPRRCVALYKFVEDLFKGKVRRAGSYCQMSVKVL